MSSLLSDPSPNCSKNGSCFASSYSLASSSSAIRTALTKSGQLQLGDPNRLDEIDHVRDPVPIGLQDVGAAIDDEGVGPVALLPSTVQPRGKEALRL
jgi:hypothetical protein